MLSESELTMTVLRAFHDHGLPYLYLRNHEELPDRIGNDVDLLVAPGDRSRALAILKNSIDGTGWSIYQVIEFGPLSIYLCSSDQQFLHIDLFDRIEWHWIPFAGTTDILERKKWNGLVFHPEIRDEVYLNVMTRLGYAGIVRNKHRDQTMNLAGRIGETALIETWIHHLGGVGSRCGSLAARGDWVGLLDYFRNQKTRIFFAQILRRPASSLRGLFRYGKRSIRRIINPPGPVIAWIGAKSPERDAVQAALEPMLKKLTGREDVRVIRLNSVTNASNWLAYWIIWIFQVIPSRIRNRAVILLSEPALSSLNNNVPEYRSWSKWLAGLLNIAKPKVDIALGTPANNSNESTAEQKTQELNETIEHESPPTPTKKELIEDAKNCVVRHLCDKSA